MRSEVPWIVWLAVAWGASHACTVARFRERPFGRGLAVLGAGAAGFLAGLTSLLCFVDPGAGVSASPSGYGGPLSDAVRRLLQVVGPLSVAGGGLGTWLGLRWSRAPRSRVALAAGSAVVGAAAVAAIFLR